MTTIVRHRRTGNHYIFLGIDRSGGKINLPSRFLNDLFTQEASEDAASVMLCDARGNIFLAYIDELIVTEIDGQKPSEILPQVATPTVENDFNSAEDSDPDSENPERRDRSSSSPDVTVDTKAEFSSGDNSPDDDEEWI
jgi:hypothetical protein